MFEYFLCASTNQDLIKETSPKLSSQRLREGVYKTLSTSIIYSPMSTLSLEAEM